MKEKLPPLPPLGLLSPDPEATWRSLSDEDKLRVYYRANPDDAFLRIRELDSQLSELLQFGRDRSALVEAVLLQAGKSMPTSLELAELKKVAESHRKRIAKLDSETANNKKKEYEAASYEQLKLYVLRHIERYVLSDPDDIANAVEDGGWYLKGNPEKKVKYARRTLLSNIRTILRKAKQANKNR